MENSPQSPAPGSHVLISQLIGFALFFLILFAPTPLGMNPVAQRLAAVTALMAVLWLSQAIPIAATSLIPLVAFPLLGIESAASVSKAYMSSSVFLFLGGFVIALGIEKWNLHRRVALHIVRTLGSNPSRIVLGFMLATAFLSMWISNTASTLLMLPIGLALLSSFRELSSDDAQSESALESFSVILMLGIAYSASIGGFTTLVGTPTNVQFAQIWTQQFPDQPEISAGEWMMAVVPIGAIFLLICWRVLIWRLPTIPGSENFNRQFFSERIRELGKVSRPEKMMMAIFVTTAALWIFRKPLQFGGDPTLPGWSSFTQQWLIGWGVAADDAANFVHDSTVAMGMALLMFFIPAKRNENREMQYLMDWKTAETLPWGILLLIGGGFAIAGAFSSTGLSVWMGDTFAEKVSTWPPILLVGSTCLLMTFLTELTSNVATVSAVLPVLAEVSTRLEIDPRLLMIPAAISTSCAFMLPIATPPNAIVFGSGKIPMGKMVRYGLVLNLVGVLLITASTFLLLGALMGIRLG